jgi:hypothetical protein
MARSRNAGHIALLALLAALCGCPLAGCAAWEALKERVGVLGMGFALEGVDVSRLIYPSDFLSAAISLISPDRSLLGRIGVDVLCDIKATNANPSRAVFDGATGRLRVQDTSPSDPSAVGAIPAFSVGPNADTIVRVTFPLRLDNPVFRKAAWKAIVRGSDVPYRVDAEMRFRLPGAAALGLPDSTRPLTLNVVKGTVNAKAAGGSAVDRILAMIESVL